MDNLAPDLKPPILNKTLTPRENVRFPVPSRTIHYLYRRRFITLCAIFNG